MILNNLPSSLTRETLQCSMTISPFYRFCDVLDPFKQPGKGVCDKSLLVLFTGVVGQLFFLSARSINLLSVLLALSGLDTSIFGVEYVVKFAHA